MSFPVYFRIGGFRFHPHFLFEVAAYLLAFLTYLYLRQRFGDRLDASDRWSVIAAAFFGAALGSRMLSVFENPAHLSVGGKTIVGGLIGGLATVELLKHLVGIRQSTGDLFAIPLCVGIAVGRIGCFLTGLSDNTYGSESNLPWAINFGDGIRRHPVQLYESLFSMLLAGVLWCIQRRSAAAGRSLPQGDLFKIFMIVYMAWRLAIDFLKPGVTLRGLTAIQWGCILVVAYYAGDIIRWTTAVGRKSRAMAVDA